MSIILSPRSHKEVKRDSKRAVEWVKELSFAVVDAFVGENEEGMTPLPFQEYLLATQLTDTILHERFVRLTRPSLREEVTKDHPIKGVQGTVHFHSLAGLFDRLLALK